MTLWRILVCGVVRLDLNEGKTRNGNLCPLSGHGIPFMARSGAFWFCTYEGGLNAELFVELLREMMKSRRKPILLLLDSLPAHKTALVKKYVASTEARLTLHFLPGYAPDLNPDELVWSHVKRAGTARRPLQKGEKLRDKIEQQLAMLQSLPHLVRSFFKASSVAYISDC